MAPGPGRLAPAPVTAGAVSDTWPLAPIISPWLAARSSAVRNSACASDTPVAASRYRAAIAAMSPFVAVSRAASPDRLALAASAAAPAHEPSNRVPVCVRKSTDSFSSRRQTASQSCAARCS